MDLKNIIILISVGVNLSLGIFVYLKGPRKLVNKVYGFLALSVFFWSIGMVLYRLAPTVEWSIFWCKILYATPIFIVGSFLYFTYIFPEEKAWPTKKSLMFVIPACLLMLYLVLFTETIVKGILFNPGKEKIIIFGKLYFIYVLFIPGFFIWAYINLLRKRYASVGIVRVQITYVFWGTFLASLLGMTTNLSLPTFGIFYFNWLGQILSVIMSVFIAYAILKHHLMNIKIITTEIFSILASLVLFVNVLLSKSHNDFILNLILFSAITFLSILLIRSVLKEVKSKEELAQMAAKLQKANIDLHKLDKAKSEFISIASHQLRTPLSIIKGFISMLQEGSYGALPDKAKEILAKIETSNDRLNRLINDLLDLSRMEGGRMKFDWEFVPLTDLVQSVVDELKPQAEAKKLEFKWNPYSEKVYVRADQQKLRHVIMNLVDNAIKYTPQGFVEVKLEKVGEKALLSIKDTGIGMDQDELGLIFGKFIRGKKVPKLWTEGIGLGLYVAKKILEEHKGRIWAESEGENKGSTFFVELPVY